MIVITFGTFDLLHIGHINILERAKQKGDKLIVGISTDKLNFSKKSKSTIYSEKERMKIIDSLKFVDHVFFEESLEQKREYILKYKADMLVMGNDWEGRFDEFKDICQVIYLERTPSISTTHLVEVIKNK
jgi:glycerol-3-phosphate cytidylyltransferase